MAVSRFIQQVKAYLVAYKYEIYIALFGIFLLCLLLIGPMIKNGRAPQEFAVACDQDCLLLEIPEQENNRIPALENCSLALKPLFFAKIPVNWASSELLQTVPGIGETTAKRIMDAREKGIIFQSATDLLQVKGIGQIRAKKFSQYLSFEQESYDDFRKNR